jgi:hypothetical protein
MKFTLLVWIVIAGFAAVAGYLLYELRSKKPETSDEW